MRLESCGGGQVCSYVVVGGGGGGAGRGAGEGGHSVALRLEFFGYACADVAA